LSGWKNNLIFKKFDTYSVDNASGDWLKLKNRLQHTSVFCLDKQLIRIAPRN